MAFLFSIYNLHCPFVRLVSSPGSEAVMTYQEDYQPSPERRDRQEKRRNDDSCNQKPETSAQRSHPFEPARLPGFRISESQARTLREALRKRLTQVMHDIERPDCSTEKIFSVVLKFFESLEKSPLTRKARAEIINKRSGAAKSTIMHLLAERQVPSYIWAQAHSLGFKPNTRNADGETALMVSARSAHQGLTAAAYYFRDKRYDFRACDLQGRNLFEIAFAAGNLEQAASLLTISKVMRKYANETTILVDQGFGRDEAISVAEAFAVVHEFHRESDQHIANELLRFIKERGILRHAYAYVASFSGMIDDDGRYLPKAFAKFLPTIYCQYQHDQINYMLQAFEHMMDTHTKLQRYHPNSGDMLALLSHPTNEHLHDHDTLARAFTSPYRLWYNGAKRLPPASIDALKVIGILQYSLLQLKYEALHTVRYVPDEGMVRQPSILEHYGLRAVKPEGIRSEFGAIYYLRAGSKSISCNLDYFGPVTLGSDVTIAIMQGGFIACGKRGTLFIRNSSLKFGRDLLEEPAYYSRRCLIRPETPKDETEAILRSFNPTWLDRHASHILTPALHQRSGAKFEPVHHLTSQIYLLTRDIRHWQCDFNANTARVIDEQGKTRMQGAYKSPGFAPTVEMLRNLYSEIAREEATSPGQARRMPVLSLVVSRFIPWLEYGSLTLGAEQLKSLKNLANQREKTDLDLMHSSGVYDFINLGLVKSASLMIKEPVESGKE